MPDPYVLKGKGEITTIPKPGVVSGTTDAFFSKQEYTTLKSELAALEKKAPATLNALMQNRPLDKADVEALKAAGIDTGAQALANARAVREQVVALKVAEPEVFLRGAEGRPVKPES